MFVAFSAGGALYYSSSSLLWKEAVQNSSNTLQLLKNGQEIVLAEVNKAMENVLLDSSFLNYTDVSNQSSVYTKLQFQQRLDRVVLSSDYIHSVYIYYTGPRYVLSSIEGSVPLSSLKDREFVESLSGETVAKSIVRTRHLPGISSAEDETVITMVKTMPIIHSGTPAAYVIVNIKGDYLVKIMNSLNTNKNARLFITDPQGNILSQKASEDAFSLSDMPGRFDISPLNGSSGSLFTKIGGVESLVCYVSSEPSGWLYIYTVPKAVVTQSLQLWSKAAIAICALAALLSLAGSVVLSRRVFHPLGRLLSLLKGASPSSAGSMPEDGKEIAQIERNVGRLIDRNRDLTMLLKDYEIQSRNKFLLRLACGVEQVTAQTMERLTYYGVSLGETGRYVVAIVSMDDFAKFSQETHESERNALLLTLSERIRVEAFVNRSLQGYLIETESSEMVIVLYRGTMEPGEELWSSELHSWFRYLHGLLQSDTNLSFTLGVSSVRERLNELGECYFEAESAVRQKLVYGFNNVIFYESVRTDRGMALYPLAIERNVLTQLKTGNREGVLHGLREFESYLLEHHSGQMEQVRHYFLQFFSSSLRCIYEMDANFGFKPVIRQILHTDLLGLETMQQMTSYMQNLYEQVLDQLEQKRSLKNKELAGSVNAYIDKHFGEDLSIEQISDIFAISVSHLRKIYKEETGMTIRDRLSQKRIAKAKELLGDPRQKIQDIASQVGYSNVQSFTKAFKAETGKSPGEYRDQQLRSNSHV
nr:helix-turn-helix domain-containing protein [Paenibacillus hamazuiensis]